MVADATIQTGEKLIMQVTPFTVVAILLFLSGCVSSKVNHGTERIKDVAILEQLVPGLTKEQVSDIVGRPETHGLYRGFEYWTYVRAVPVADTSNREENIESIAFYVKFDSDGKLVSPVLMEDDAPELRDVPELWVHE